MSKLCAALLFGLVATPLVVLFWLDYQWEADSWKGGPFKFYGLDSADYSNKQKYSIAVEKLKSDVSKIANMGDLIEFAEAAGLECDIHRYRHYPDPIPGDERIYLGFCQYMFGDYTFYDVARIRFTAKLDSTLVDKKFSAGAGWK